MSDENYDLAFLDEVDALFLRWSRVPKPCSTSIHDR